MKAGITIKIIIGLLLIALLIFACVRMVDIFASAVVNILSGNDIEMETDEQIMITPEPMPTMPAYMGEDSFYDNAGSVIFDDE